MSEVITETIIPGTYIEVRAEGLLTVGAIPTGNIGLIGTAEKGSHKIEILSSYDQGRAIFGDLKPWDPTADGANLTMVRAMKLIFDNGARAVYAKRVFKDRPAGPNDEDYAVPSTFDVLASNGGSLRLRAKTAGSWGNTLELKIDSGETRELITNENVNRSNGNFVVSAQAIEQLEAPDGEQPSIGNVIVRDEGLPRKYPLKIAPAEGDVVQINPTSRILTFPVHLSNEAEVRASYLVPKDKLRLVTLRYQNIQEVYLVPSISYLAQLISDERNPSKLVEVEEINGDGVPESFTVFKGFSGGKNGGVAPGNFVDALEELVDQNVQIVVVAGLNFSQIKSALLGHVEKTENLGRERIVVVGADRNDTEKVRENVDEIADKRIILVAPGIRQMDLQTGNLVEVPPYFAAAAVAGKLSSVSPHISLTNKTIAGIDELAVEYNYGQLKSLVDNRVMTLQKKRGIRVVKGITTHDEAFRQVSIRRIVDYIKEGTRRGANQYIGKLNNPRVRSALHTTLNGFLTDMVTREFLTGYQLSVFADRAMEIRGEVLVTMDLQPTFSIDVIRVIMNLS